MEIALKEKRAIAGAEINGFGGCLSGEPRSEGHAGFALMENEHGPRRVSD
jgi:hypothetical protein